MSEQPLLYNLQSERDDKIRLETTNNANYTTFASVSEGTNNIIIDADGENLSKTPEETVPTVENDDDQPEDNNELGIFQTAFACSSDDPLISFDLYNNKKLLTQSMMDIALFSANANQLRNLMQNNDGQIITTTCIILLVISILLQILVGALILLSIQYKVSNREDRKIAFTYGNYVIVGIFLITVINVLISAFGGPKGTGN